MNARSSLTAAIAALALGSCRLPVLSEFENAHMICVDVYGNAKDVEVQGIPNPPERHRLEHQVGLVADAVRAGLEDDSIDGIVLIVHGGLVDMEGAMREAQATLNAMNGDGRYPIFVNWETGIVRSYSNSLFGVRLGRHEHWGAHLSTPAFFLAGFGGALSRLPITYTYQGYRGLQDYTGFGRDIHQPDATWSHRARLSEAGGGRRGVLSRVGGLLYGVFPGAVRVVTTPLLDWIGTPAYRNMRRRAALLFDRDRDFERAEEGRPTRPTGALSLLMAELEPAFEAKRKPLEIDIIAHSMGALVGNEFVYRNPDARIRDIVYMGAACTISDFARTVLPYLKLNPGTRFYNLSLHPDEEIDDKYGGGLLPYGSLLVWIDDYITEQRSHLDRTLGAWNNIVPALPLLSIDDELRERMTFKGFGRTDADPKDHGDFNDADMGFWKRDFWELPPAPGP